MQLRHPTKSSLRSQVRRLRESGTAKKEDSPDTANKNNDGEKGRLRAEVERLASELTEALRRSPSKSGGGGADVEGEDGEDGPRMDAPAKPLLFAMSKENELAVAREEISRLASSLGDMASSKSEAMERADDLDRDLAAANAKCERLETMGGGEGNVNAEYLKNILLQYLVAQSNAEKKLLLSVLSSVLSFTDDEKQRSIEALDGNKGLRGVGEIVLDGVEGVKEEGLVGGVLNFVGLTPGRNRRRSDGRG